MTRLLLFAVALTPVLACASRQSVDTVLADTYRLRLDIVEIRDRQDSVRAQVDALRRDQSREVGELRERLDALQEDLTDLQAAVDRLGQPQMEPSTPSGPSPRPTAGRVSVGPTTAPAQP